MSLGQLRSQHGPIAFASYTKANDVSGVTTWLEGLITRLHADGVPVVLLLLFYGSKVPEVGFWTRLIEAGIVVEIEAVSLEEERDRPRVYVRRVIDFLARHKPQVFLPNCRNVLYFAARIAGQQGLPWIFTIHSDDPLFWSLAKATQPTSANGCHVAVSHHVGELLSDKGLERQAQVIPYGVPLSKKSTFFSDHPFRVAYTGRLIEEQKRISLVLAAMALACKADPRIECCLIGDGPDAERSKRWVKEQGLEDRILFSGRLDVSEVRQKVSEFQVILLLSDYEGLGISLLEAMTCGVVPVVRRMPPLTEFVKHQQTGLLVDASAEQTSKAILHLLEDRDLWAHCSEGARLMVADEYSEDRSYARWVECLAEVSTRSACLHPLHPPGWVPIPLPYEPTLLRLQGIWVGWRWRLIQLWYQRILPVLVRPRNVLRKVLRG